jgi:hypothetical protein
VAEETFLMTLLKSVAAAGPVALVLGVLCWKLWEQNQKLIDKLEHQQIKMLRLAVRVQRAVEALAGLEDPEIEEDLEDSPDPSGST